MYVVYGIYSAVYCDNYEDHRENGKDRTGGIGLYHLEEKAKYDHTYYGAEGVGDKVDVSKASDSVEELHYLKGEGEAEGGKRCF